MVSICVFFSKATKEKAPPSRGRCCPRARIGPGPRPPLSAAPGTYLKSRQRFKPQSSRSLSRTRDARSLFARSVDIYIYPSTESPAVAPRRCLRSRASAGTLAPGPAPDTCVYDRHATSSESVSSIKVPPSKLRRRRRKGWVSKLDPMNRTATNRLALATPRRGRSAVRCRSASTYPQ